MANRKPLGMIYTLGGVVKTILLWLKKETQQELEPEFVKSLVNLAVLDTAQSISKDVSDDYGETASISDTTTNLSANVVTNGNYTDSSKTVNKNAHGLANGDLGKRIVVWITSRVLITRIENIVDENNFVIEDKFGLDVLNSLFYAVLTMQFLPVFDISSLPVMNITKISDTVNKEIIPIDEKTFENLARYPDKQSKIYFTKHGQTLFFYKGSKVASTGEWTLFFNSYPQKAVEDTDYLDIRDIYAPVYIAKAKNYCLEHLGLTIPGQQAG